MCRRLMAIYGADDETRLTRSDARVQQTEASRRLFALSASVFLRNRIP